MPFLTTNLYQPTSPTPCQISTFTVFVTLFNTWSHLFFFVWLFSPILDIHAPEVLKLGLPHVEPSTVLENRNCSIEFAKWIHEEFIVGRFPQSHRYRFRDTKVKVADTLAEWVGIYFPTKTAHHSGDVIVHQDTGVLSYWGSSAEAGKTQQILVKFIIIAWKEIVLSHKTPQSVWTNVILQKAR